MKTSILLCLFAASVCFAKFEVIVQNVTVMAGEDAVIPCNYETDEDVKPRIIWHLGKTATDAEKIYDFNNNGDTYPDDSLAEIRQGVTVNDNGFLQISQTTLQDNIKFGDLLCEVQFGKEGIVYGAIKFVVVLFPTEDAKTRLQSYTKGQTGFNTENGVNANVGTCESSASYPAAKITFFKNGEAFEKIGEGDALGAFFETAQYTISDDGVSELTEKDLIKELEASDHQAEFVCNVKTVSEDKVFEKNYTMPKFNVNYETTKVEFVATPDAYLDEEITLKCVADGFPDAVITLNDEEISEKTIVVTQDSHQVEYKCKAYNNDPAAAVESSVYTLEVLYLSEPQIKGSKAVMLDEDIELTCTSDGRPQPSLTWYKGDKKISDSGVLTISKSTFEDSATYTCRAENGHDVLKKSSDVDVDVRGILLEGVAEETIAGKKDETVTLYCSAESNPEPTFKWSDEEATSSEVKTGHTYTSQITVGPLTPAMSETTYTCTIENDDGLKIEKTFKLPEIKSNSTREEVVAEASSATAGIIIALLVVLLIIAIILAVLYNKGIICRKGEKGDESAEGDIAVEINNDDGDVEAGNGKAAAETEPPVESNEEEKLMNGENSNE